jgi:hypothetical protein
MLVIMIKKIKRSVHHIFFLGIEPSNVFVKLSLITINDSQLELKNRKPNNKVEIK